VPKLLDFGIAKLLDPTAKDHNATRLSQRMMTLEYASPRSRFAGGRSPLQRMFTLSGYCSTSCLPDTTHSS
jgi:hypothetical protein